MLKILLLLTSVVLFSINFVAAQENENKKSPQLIDEYGRIIVSAEIARLDNYAVAMQNDPTAKAFIIQYRSHYQLRGAGFRHLKGIENYLVNSRGFDSKRIVLIDGGAVNCPKTELWLAPAGTAPKPTENPYQTVFEDFESARKFDEFYYPSANEDTTYIDIWNGYGFGFANSIEPYAAALFKEPKSVAYIIFYPRYDVQRFEYTEENGRTYKKGEIISDSPRTTAQIMRAIKNEMVRKYNFPAARIKLVKGGYRKFRAVETWILPRGEHPPVATPDSFPNFRKK
ncbi:MAG TPA: hypothetical protein VF571_11275 [Pyrinomonadaceae bacterium]|jgi:hypothetical protein